MVQVNTPITVRIKFKKIGGLQYISHLDLVRTMHKIIVRADLPLWYTEGFNPKPKMVFAAPLSIGTESVSEYMDLRLTERMAEHEIMNRLNYNLTDEMQVLEVYYPETKLTELKWMNYIIRIKTAKASGEFAKSIEDFLSSEHIVVSKKTKLGEPEKRADIAPLIKSASVSLDGGELVISACLSGDQSAFLNPEYLIKALVGFAGVPDPQKPLVEYYSIMRESAFCDDMTPFR